MSSSSSRPHASTGIRDPYWLISVLDSLTRCPLQGPSSPISLPPSMSARVMDTFAATENNTTTTMSTQCAETGGAGEQLLPNKIIGEQLVHPVFPAFFCNLQLKVTLYCYFWHKKILENSPASEVLPHTPFYTAYTFFEKYISHKVILWLWLSWLFFHQFLLPNRKIVSAPMPMNVKCQCQKWIYMANSRSKPLMHVTH